MSKKSSLRAAVGLGLAVACLLPAWHPHSLAQETGGPVAGGRLVASGVENPTDRPAGVSADWWAAVQPTIASGTSVSQSVGPDWIYAGDQAEAQLGFVVATAGDVNGDGYADVIVGSRWYSAEGSYRSGRAYLFHGSADGLPTTPTRIIEPPVVNSNGWFGNSVGTAGDVNGDGYDDVIIGMPNYEGGSVAPQDEGAVFVWYGSSSGIAATHDWMAESETLWAHFGMSSGTAGDVNGDGYDDIIVGAFLTSSTNTVSHAYVWYGSDSGLGESGTPANADWYAETITTQAYTGFGSSVGTAGDVNGDGYDDVVVTAPFFDNSYTDEGAVFVWHGSSSGLGGPGTPANADWKVYGGQASARLGGYDSNGANTAGDVNDDGYDDLIAGAYQYDNSETNEGRVYVWHGSALGLSATPDWTAEGEQEGALLGYMVDTAGDVNGDGYDDVVVGAYGYDTDISNAGAALVWYGSLAGLGEDGTPDNADWMATGDQENGYHGWAVATAGDVNGDGLDDVIVGAPTYDNSEADNSGRAYVYHGSSPCRARLNDGPTDYYTVQAAVDASTDPGDVVKVAGTCSGVWARGGLTQTLYLSQTLIVQGGYTTTNWTTADPAAYPTTLDAQGLGRVIYTTGDIAPVVEGLHITGGDADDLGGIGQYGDRDGGGGIYVITATATITNCTIYTNTAEGGAAIALANSSATVAGNDIYMNLATNQGGGGVWIGGPATSMVADNAIHDNDSVGGGGGAVACFYTSPTLSENQMVGNTSDEDGGGVYLQGCEDAVLTANEILTNTADWVGGGLFFDDSTATLSGNIIRDNQAEWGGGVYLFESPAILMGNVIRGNDAEWEGGAAHIEDSSPLLINNAIVGNHLTHGGEASGLFITGSSLTSLHTTLADNEGGNGAALVLADTSVVTMTNTIIAGHTTGVLAEAGSAATLDGVLWYDNTDKTGGGGTVTIQHPHDGDPAFDADGYHLTRPSAAIDRGVVAAVDTDIDGDARPLNYGFDLGADEYDGDLILPEVVGREPAPGAIDVPVDAAIVITFSETIDTGSFAYTVAPDPGGWSAVWSAGDTVVTLSHLDFAAASSYTVTVSAADDLADNPLADAPVAWAFTTVQEAPAITSADSTTFVAGAPGSFTVTATGVPTPEIDVDGALPAGVMFTDHGDGTASLAGTPAAGATGEYPLMVTASNGVAPDATQAFTLTVNQPPAITSADSTTFVAGASGSFTVTATGIPTPTIDVDGALPAGVTFIDHGDGTASLAGTPAAGATGEYPLMVTVSNGVAPDATQDFTLTVEARIYLPLVVRSTG